MDSFRAVNVAAVQNSWAIIKQDIYTNAPQFYVALLTAHPEYQVLFHSFANVPASQLIHNDALKGLSIKVFSRLTELIDALGNPDAEITKLIDLANEHRGRGTSQTHFENAFVVLMNFLADKLGPAFDAETKQAWTVFIEGITTVLRWRHNM